MTPVVFLPLYCTRVRLRLEYAIQATPSYSRNDIYHTKKFKRLAKQMVKKLHHLVYKYRL